MRENLSAPGTVSEWMQISRHALVNLGYHNITKDPVYARLSADYGYDEHIIVNVRNKEEGTVLLEFDVTSPKLIKQFQTASAQVIRQMQNNYRRRNDERKYGPETTQSVSYNTKDYINASTPEYQAEEGDFIERTRLLPEETLILKEYHENTDHRNSLKFREKFEYYFNRLWVIWLCLFLFPPFGLFLLWYFKRLYLLTRIFTTLIFVLYFFLIWVGVLGIDTGFNREGIQKFYDTQQYRITRFLNEIDNARGVNTPVPADEEDLPTSEDMPEEY